MEKLNKYVPVGLLLVYVLKCLITNNVQFVDASILAVFACLLAYSQYKTEEKSISLLKSEILLLKNEQEEIKKHHEELRSHMSSMKIGLSMRSGSLSGKPSL